MAKHGARMRVAVIGLGGSGTAAARFLAAEGHEVVGFERFPLGHAHGSSHGASRIIRFAYKDPLYTRLMAEAYPLWRELQREAAEELFVRCGCLYFGDSASAELSDVESALAAQAVPFERLDAAAVAARFPVFRLPPSEHALFQADAGFLRADRVVRASARLARAHGAELREGVAVEALEPEAGGGVRVRSGGAWERFDRAVITAGAWTGKLLAALGLPLVVTRQEVVYLRPVVDPAAFDAARMPVWIHVPSHFYGFPRDGEVAGVKLARHEPGPVIDPDAPRAPPSAEAAREAAAFAATRLVGLGDEPTFQTTCLYTNAPDEDFVLDEVPGLPAAYLVSGCSGHGFKFTVLLGRIAADHVLGRQTRDVSRFGLGRFGAT